MPFSKRRNNILRASVSVFKVNSDSVRSGASRGNASSDSENASRSVVEYTGHWSGTAADALGNDRNGERDIGKWTKTGDGSVSLRPSLGQSVSPNGNDNSNGSSSNNGGGGGFLARLSEGIPRKIAAKRSYDRPPPKRMTAVVTNDSGPYARRNVTAAFPPYRLVAADRPSFATVDDGGPSTNNDTGRVARLSRGGPTGRTGNSGGDCGFYAADITRPDDKNNNVMMNGDYSDCDLIDETMDDGRPAATKTGVLPDETVIVIPVDDGNGYGLIDETTRGPPERPVTDNGHAIRKSMAIPTDRVKNGRSNNGITNNGHRVEHANNGHSTDQKIESPTRDDSGRTLVDDSCESSEIGDGFQLTVENVQLKISKNSKVVIIEGSSQTQDNEKSPSRNNKRSRKYSEYNKKGSGYFSFLG